MKKYILIIVSLVFLSIYITNFNLIFGTEVNKSKIEDKTKILESINSCKEEIKEKINKMELKLESLKSKREYENYPAIRLNMDTPIFGINSVYNQKLKIKDEVSAADVAKGYSIKDILKTDSLKVPSFTVGSITVITRDVKFDKNITTADANTCILKLIEYTKQVEELDEFLDKQITKIYKGYIPEEKSKKIENLKADLKTIKKVNEEINQNLLTLYISKINNELYNELSNEYIDINSKVYSYDNALNDVLMNDETLTSYENKVKELKEKQNKLKEKLNVGITELNNKIEVSNVLKSLREELVSKKEKIDVYIKNSVIKKDIQNLQVGSEIENSEESKKVSDIAEEEIKIYEVVSTDLLNNLNNYVEKIDENIKNILGENVLNEIKGIKIEGQTEEVVNKQEVNNVKELTLEEKNKLMIDLKNIYSDFVKNENKFYLDNLNFLLNDSKNKIEVLSKYTNYHNVSDIKYIFLTAPKIIEEDGLIYDKDLVLQVNKYTSILQKELESVLKINKEVNTEYKNKVSEDLKNKY